MRILVVADDMVWRRAAVNALRAEDNSVAEADTTGVVELVKAAPPDVLVFRWPEVDGTSGLQATCGAEPNGSMFVLVVLGDESPRTLGTALAAGAHDVVRERYFLDEVCSRVDARARLWRWMGSVDTAQSDQRGKLATSRAWRHLGDIVADELGSMLGASLELARHKPATSQALRRAAALTMTFAAERDELRLNLATDDATLARLGDLLLGDAHANDDAKRDLLREMLNAAGGAVKRAALPEKVTLTLGLPCDAAAQVDNLRGRAWMLSANDLSLVVSAGLYPRENERVLAAKLCEGMVVVHDVRGSGGMLLVPGGTRLTMTTAVRLAGMLGERALVEIANAS